MIEHDAIVEVIKMLAASISALSGIIDQPDDAVLYRDAQRIDKPMEERSVPGIIILNK